MISPLYGLACELERPACSVLPDRHGLPLPAACAAWRVLAMLRAQGDGRQREVMRGKYLLRQSSDAFVSLERCAAAYRAHRPSLQTSAISRLTSRTTPTMLRLTQGGPALDATAHTYEGIPGLIRKYAR